MKGVATGLSLEFSRFLRDIIMKTIAAVARPGQYVVANAYNRHHFVSLCLFKGRKLDLLAHLLANVCVYFVLAPVCLIRRLLSRTMSCHR